MKDVLIIFNPACSKCRQSMELLEENNCSIETVKYLEGELTEDLLRKVINALNVHPKVILRTKDEAFKDLTIDLDNAEEVIQAILKDPRLLERPLLLSGDKAVIGRPPENILKLFSILILFLVMSCATPTKKISEGGTDFHMHIHSPPEDSEDDMQFNAKRALFAADSIGLSRALVLSNAYSRNVSEEYAQKENNFVAAEVAKDPGHLAGACAVNPVKNWAPREIKRCSVIGLKVLKLHFLASGMDLRNGKDFETARAAIRNAEHYKLTIIVHANYPRVLRPGEIEKLKQLIEEFPKTRWIIGHLFGREFDVLKSLKHPDFFVETSVAPVWMKSDEEKKNLVSVMRAVGMEKFVFGSDWPVIHPAENLKALNQLPLTENEKEAILFTNAEKLSDLF